jgi:hypothetical protein
MKTNRNLWMALSAAVLLTIPFTASSQSEIPAAINYQGRLTDTLGNPLPSGYYEIEFRIWDDAVANQPGDLVWARSFPLHVVTNGLFNILLTDAGGQVTTPTTTTNTLLDAFKGPDRYLGLTVTVSNGVNVSESEISPRQQLASAPFAIQAQTANTVVAGGVTGNMLQSGSVTTSKMADNAVSTTKIADGAVTSSKLNIDEDIQLNGHAINLQGGNVTTNGLKYVGSFGGSSYDGPALFGYTSGVLGTTQGGEKAALNWDNTQSVTAEGDLAVKGVLTAQTNLTVRGNTYIRSGSVSMFGPLVTRQFNKRYTATSDGFVIFWGQHGYWNFALRDAAGNTVVNALAYAYSGGADQTMVTFPVAKGESWAWGPATGHTDVTGTVQIWWRPMGGDSSNQ